MNNFIYRLTNLNEDCDKRDRESERKEHDIYSTLVGCNGTMTVDTLVEIKVDYNWWGSLALGALLIVRCTFSVWLTFISIIMLVLSFLHVDSLNDANISPLWSLKLFLLKRLADFCEQGKKHPRDNKAQKCAGLRFESRITNHCAKTLFIRYHRHFHSTLLWLLKWYDN